MLVTGWQQALTVLVIVVPGFVYQIVRSRLRGPGPEDGDVGVRVLRALTASGLFTLIYFVALGQILTSAISHPESYLDHPRSTALLLLVTHHAAVKERADSIAGAVTVTSLAAPATPE